MKRSVWPAAALTLGLGAWLYREDWKELYAYLERRQRARQRLDNRRFLREQLHYALERQDRELWSPSPWSPIHPSVLPPISGKSHVMHSLIEQFQREHPDAVVLHGIDLSGGAELGPWQPASGTDDGVRHGREETS